MREATEVFEGLHKLLDLRHGEAIPFPHIGHEADGVVQGEPRLSRDLPVALSSC